MSAPVRIDTASEDQTLKRIRSKVLVLIEKGLLVVDRALDGDKVMNTEFAAAVKMLDFVPDTSKGSEEGLQIVFGSVIRPAQISDTSDPQHRQDELPHAESDPLLTDGTAHRDGRTDEGET